MIDHTGEIVDGDQILYVLASNSEKPVSGVVGILMSNLGLEVALKELGIDFIRTKVGDRYVMEALKENGWDYGAESSGHVLCLDKTSTGDGIVAALQIMSIITRTGKSLQALASGMQKMPQLLKNVRVADKVDVSSSAVLQAAISDSEARMAGKGRVLIRASGTEPLIRVMVEGQDMLMIESEVNALLQVVESEFS